MIPYSWLAAARKRIQGSIRTTPLTHDKAQGWFLKWENQQVTGSFKVRGALNKTLTLQPWELERGLVAASAGNHGQGLALAASIVGARATIFASQAAVPSKVEAMRRLGAEVVLVPGGYGEAEQAGLDYAESQQATWVSPYNDGQIIAGQGTLGLEILEQLPPLASSTWVVPVGGGGLISGIGAAIKPDANNPAARNTDRKLIGVQSDASPFFYYIFHHGSQEGTLELPSLADGLSGPVQDRSLTIPLVRAYLDDLILVSEAEIAEAIRYAWQNYGERIEGSAAAALAGVISGKISARPAVVVLSGGNIQAKVHAGLVEGT
jgi:threonine dehydratase